MAENFECTPPPVRRTASRWNYPVRELYGVPTKQGRQNGLHPERCMGIRLKA
jgi:hypothetical protein